MNLKQFTKKCAYTAIPAVALAMSAPMTAQATNGYFSHGVGIKSKAMGGVGIAKSYDSLAAGTNPANMVSQGNRFDVGLDRFTPDRKTSITNNGSLGNVNYDPNEDESFLIPEIGYNHMLGDNMAVGVSVYGNGGMNTSYKQAIGLFGTSKAGVNLEQLFIAPTFSMKVNSKNTFGVSLNIIQQTFSANGLENFDNANQSTAPGFVTNKGDDTSSGYNIRLGWNAEVADGFNIAAMYQSKADMENFESYKGLFAEQGDFDIPSTYGIGINYSPSSAVNVGFDVVKINYSEVAAISNPLGGDTGGVLNNKLGANNGAGFGWQDMTVYKLGASFKVSDSFNVLAGWNHGDQPIPADQTFFNLLAPGVVEDHYTLGLTWDMADKSQVTFMYMYAPEATVNGSNSISPNFGDGEANLSMSQNSFGIAYGLGF